MENKTIKRCIAVAEEVYALNQEKVIINASGVGGPSVLMREEAFNALFPACEHSEWETNADGKLFRINTASVSGVSFSCVEYAEDNDGLGG